MAAALRRVNRPVVVVLMDGAVGDALGIESVPSRPNREMAYAVGVERLRLDILLRVRKEVSTTVVYKAAASAISPKHYVYYVASIRINDERSVNA